MLKELETPMQEMINQIEAELEQLRMRRRSLQKQNQRNNLLTRFQAQGVTRSAPVNFLPEGYSTLPQL